MRRAQLWPLIGLAAIVASAGACSSSNSAGAPTSKPPANHSAASVSAPAKASASGTPIKVGFMCSCSGSPELAQNPPVEDAYKVWASSVNASGGIDGHPIQLVAEDDENNPGTALSDLQTLIGDHVSAIVDNSVVDTAWASEAQAAKIPVIGILTNGSSFTTSPDFYPEAQTNDSVLYAVASIAKQAGANSIGDIYGTEVVLFSETVPPLKAAASQLGVPDVYNAAISGSQPNYTAQCLAAKQRHVQALFVAEASPVVIRFAADCAKQGYDPIYVVESPGYGTSMNTASGLNNKLYIEFSGAPFTNNSPIIKMINTAVDKAYPGLTKNGNIWQENGVLAWSSGLLLEDAAKAGGLQPGQEPSPAELIKGLQSLHGDTLQGMAPPLTFTPGKPHLVDCWFVAHVQSGVATVTNAGKPTCKAGAA